jgi:hypothetical protein
MSLRSIFANIASGFLKRKWGRKIHLPDGRVVDTGVHEFVEELFVALTSGEPIVLQGPIVLHNPGDGPAIEIVNTGTVDHEGVRITDGSGRQVKLGIGLGSENIIASEVIPLPSSFVDPEVVTQKWSALGKGGGEVKLSPGTTENPDLIPFGHGIESVTGMGTGLGSGYETDDGGTGVSRFADEKTSTIVPKGGYGQMLDSLQKSNRDGHGGKVATHAPNAGHLLSLNHNPLWWAKDMHGWMPNRATINKDYGDWLDCSRYDIGDQIKVCKPYWLQRTPFDGKTVDGVTYAYTSNQCRTATDSTGSEVQIVHPPYRVSSGYTIRDSVYARWVSNGTSVVGAEHIDLNVDARTWVASPSGCTQSSLDSGNDECPGGICTFVWDYADEAYGPPTGSCDPNYEFPPAPAVYEGDSITVCCNPIA